MPWPAGQDQKEDALPLTLPGLRKLWGVRTRALGRGTRPSLVTDKLYDSRQVMDFIVALKANHAKPLEPVNATLLKTGSLKIRLRFLRGGNPGLSRQALNTIKP